MLTKINGQLVFSYNCPAKHHKIKTKIKNSRIRTASLLVILAGIFLLPQIGYFSDITPERLIQLTNQERINYNLQPLTASQYLTQAAYLKARAILDSQTFQHEINGQTFSYWIKQTGYKYLMVGENLAIDFATSEGITNAWMASELHRKNLLNPDFTEIGIVAVEGNFEGQPTTVIAQIFGAPFPAPVGPRVAGAEIKNLSPVPTNQFQTNKHIFKNQNSYLVPADNFFKTQTDKIFMALYFVFTNPVIVKTFFFAFLLLLTSAYFLCLSYLIKQT